MKYYKTNKGDFAKVGDLWEEDLRLFLKKGSIYIDASNRIRFSKYFHANRLMYHKVIRKVPKNDSKTDFQHMNGRGHVE